MRRRWRGRAATPWTPLAGRPGTLRDGAKFRVDTPSLAALVGTGFRTDLTPDGTPVARSGAKWSVVKAGKVKLNKAKDAVETVGDNLAALLKKIGAVKVEVK